MSSAVNPTDFSKLTGLINSLTYGMKQYLPESSDKGLVVFESSAILQLSFATLKNVPYIFLATEFKIRGLLHALSSRITYLEAALLGIVNTVHNLFFAIVYSFLTVATLGIPENVSWQCKVHWLHVIYGGMSTGIAACGVLFPYYAAGLNILFLHANVKAMNRSYQKDILRFEHDLVAYVQASAREHSPVVYDFIKSRVSNETDFDDIYVPSINYLTGKIVNASRMKDLTELAIEFYRKWPSMGLKPVVHDVIKRKVYKEKDFHIIYVPSLSYLMGKIVNASRMKNLTKLATKFFRKLPFMGLKGETSQ